MGTAIKYLKLSFVIFDIQAHSDTQDCASDCPDVKNYKWRLNPVRHKMLYGCTIWQQLASKGWESFQILFIDIIAVSEANAVGCLYVLEC